MRKRYEYYNEEDCLSIIRDYYYLGMSKCACCRKYSLSCSRLLLKWIENYESHPELVSLLSKPEFDDMATVTKRAT